MRDIRHDDQGHRFTCDTDGHVTYVAYRPLAGRCLDFYTTYTPPPVRGRGTAARVVAAALRWAEENGYQVVPSCWFVAEVIDRNPRWQGLVAPR